MIDAVVHDVTAALVAAVPFADADELTCVELGAGAGELTAMLLSRFSRATVVALEGAEPLRRTAAQRLAPFGDRVRLRSFDLETLDWWDVMFGADVVVSSMTLHRLKDPKKQYLYKAAADRVSARGVFLAADRLAPQQLLHHLVWLKHAGFAAVDCFWMRDAHAVFGGLKQAEASTPPLPAGS
jgi:trans-aconitate methyltransferase